MVCDTAVLVISSKMASFSICQDLCHAIVQPSWHEVYENPLGEYNASAFVLPPSLPGLLEGIDRTRGKFQTHIRTLTRHNDLDINLWITQMLRVQEQIRETKNAARELVQLVGDINHQQSCAQGSANEISLIDSEILFNENLERILRQIKRIAALLKSGHDTAAGGNVGQALQLLENAHNAFDILDTLEGIWAVCVLSTKKDQLSKTLIDIVIESWDALLTVDDATSSFSLKLSLDSRNIIDLPFVADALARLDILDHTLSRLSHDLDRIIIAPCLTMTDNKDYPSLLVENDLIRRAGVIRGEDIKGILNGISNLADFMHLRLPPPLRGLLSAHLAPVITSRMISGLLVPAVPLALNNVQSFQAALSSVLELVEHLKEIGWSGHNRLTEWVNKWVEVWLSKQKVAAVAHLRSMLPQWVNERKKVERVGMRLTLNEESFRVWNDKIHDHTVDCNGPDATSDIHKDRGTEHKTPRDEVVGGSQKMVIDCSEDSESLYNQEQEADGWDAEWDIEGDEDKNMIVESTNERPEKVEINQRKATESQKVTLCETYTVTAAPDSIIETILQFMIDVQGLTESDLIDFASSSAIERLYAVPELVLTMYRASAHVSYQRETGSSMLLYNDCQRLSDRLRNILQHVQTDNKIASPQLSKELVCLAPWLNNSIEIIDLFGKRAYGREMDSQRQILRDYLEDAQGFQACTDMQFTTICDAAIATTIDRIGNIKRQWQKILSGNALLQSLGSLVSEVLTRFIEDVEELSDIAENESRKLHSYCVSLATLSDYFQTQDDSGYTRDMVSIYTPNWFKFQYLSEILNSSLADIKYFWTDGGLKLEMETEEVIGLIEALFAPSDHRKRVITGIRGDMNS